MKTFKTETITREEKVVDVFSCDMCGKIAPGKYDWGEDDNHDIGVQVELNDCYYGPSDRKGYYMRTDICPECFKGKVVPALEDLGAVFRTRDMDNEEL
jgi:hypothetical protein